MHSLTNIVNRRVIIMIHGSDVLVCMYVYDDPSGVSRSFFSARCPKLDNLVYFFLEAVSSIPAAINSCRYFVVLVKPVRQPAHISTAVSCVTTSPLQCVLIKPTGTTTYFVQSTAGSAAQCPVLPPWLHHHHHHLHLLFYEVNKPLDSL